MTKLNKQITENPSLENSLNINYLNEFRNIINYSIHNLYDNYGLKNIIEGSDDHESITANIKWDPKDNNMFKKIIEHNSETIKTYERKF